MLSHTQSVNRMVQATKPIRPVSFWLKTTLWSSVIENFCVNRNHSTLRNPLEPFAYSIKPFPAWLCRDDSML